jgi:hypothetical protein
MSIAPNASLIVLRVLSGAPQARPLINSSEVQRCFYNTWIKYGPKKLVCKNALRETEVLR